MLPWVEAEFSSFCQSWFEIWRNRISDCTTPDLSSSAEVWHGPGRRRQEWKESSRASLLSELQQQLWHSSLPAIWCYSKISFIVGAPEFERCTQHRNKRPLEQVMHSLHRQPATHEFWAFCKKSTFKCYLNCERMNSVKRDQHSWRIGRGTGGWKNKL